MVTVNSVADVSTAFRHLGRCISNEHRLHPEDQLTVLPLEYRLGAPDNDSDDVSGPRSFPSASPSPSTNRGAAVRRPDTPRPGRPGRPSAPHQSSHLPALFDGSSLHSGGMLPPITWTDSVHSPTSMPPITMPANAVNQHSRSAPLPSLRSIVNQSGAAQPVSEQYGLQMATHAHAHPHAQAPPYGSQGPSLSSAFHHTQHSHRSSSSSQSVRFPDRQNGDGEWEHV